MSRFDTLTAVSEVERLWRIGSWAVRGTTRALLSRAAEGKGSGTVPPSFDRAGGGEGVVVEGREVGGQEPSLPKRALALGW
jgi:hypothetical protein